MFKEWKPSASDAGYTSKVFGLCPTLKSKLFPESNRLEKV